MPLLKSLKSLIDGTIPCFDICKASSSFSCYARNHCCSLAGSCLSPVSAFLITGHSPSVSVFTRPSFYKTLSSHIELRAHPTLVRPPLNQRHQQQPCFKIRPHSEKQLGLELQHVLLGKYSSTLNTCYSLLFKKPT